MRALVGVVKEVPEPRSRVNVMYSRERLRVFNVVIEAKGENALCVKDGGIHMFYRKKVKPDFGELS